MRHLHFLALIWFFLAHLLVMAKSLAQDKPNQKVDKTIHAKAYDLKGETLLFTEKHLLTYNDKKQIHRSITEYYDPKGKRIAVMDSDYSLSIPMPTYVFKDLRTGHQEGLQLRDGKYYIFLHRPQEARKEEQLTTTQGVYSCQGWHYFIQTHFAKVRQQKQILNLVLPSQLSHYEFKLQKTKEENGKMHLDLTLSNFFLRLFAPSMQLTYDIKSKALLSYKGPSNILDANGDLQQVFVQYSR